MKRILVILLLALILIPGVNAESVTTEYYDHKSEFAKLSYKLEPNQTNQFTINTFSFGMLNFVHEPGATINVTSLMLSQITIESTMILESPTWSESQKTTDYWLLEQDGSLLFKGVAQANMTYIRGIYSDWSDQDYILRATNTNNVTLVTCMLLEFTFFYSYTITRQVDLPQLPGLSIFDPLTSAVIIGFFIFIAGACFGVLAKQQYDTLEDKPIKKPTDDETKIQVGGT